MICENDWNRATGIKVSIDGVEYPAIYLSEGLEEITLLFSLLHLGFEVKEMDISLEEVKMIEQKETSLELIYRKSVDLARIISIIGISNIKAKSSQWEEVKDQFSLMTRIEKVHAEDWSIIWKQRKGKIYLN